MELTNKNILVVGLGVSGMAVAEFLVRRGARVTVTDAAPEAERAAAAQRMRQKGVALELGGHRNESFESADLIVVSPGVPHTIAPLARAGQRGIPIMGEVELACRFIAEPVVAVSGTNGKTTTTTLVGEMLRQSGLDVFVGGNIGDPLIGYADRGQKAGLVVAEISSFQLDTIDTFRPKVGVLLNISDDHLDRYPDFQAYARSKARLFENQTGDDVAVINGSDPPTAALADRIAARVLVYRRGGANRSEPLSEGARVLEDRIDIRLAPLPAAPQSRIQFSVERDDIRMYGRHNLDNAAAAALAALAAGGTVAGVQQALKTFEGLPHRLEVVVTVDGVTYINDSKATNMDAVLKALESVAAPTVLILGGRNKGGDFRQLLPAVRRHVKRIVAIGESRSEIAAALGAVVPVETADTMGQAVQTAAGRAVAGDAVLLAPACASFDMYPGYARRGEDFRQAATALKRTHGENG
jgi:UDP-N-acetylmuramoylalanine--D-glutamate ligase